MSRKPIPTGPTLAPSILSADFARLGEALALAERGGAGLVHVDVMDGHFVPNLTLGPPVIRSLRRASPLPFDVHLMIEDPGRWVEDFVEAGADLVSVHVEADLHLHRTVSRLRALGARTGVALNPATPWESIRPVLPDLDYVLVMSVNPGFAAQKFLSLALDKLRALRSEADRLDLSLQLEVDGGVGPDNARHLVEAGADILVAGSAVYGAPDPLEALRALVAMVEEGKR